MAKGNLFLGQARGKVGSVVFARAFGEQITRTRPTSVANPKTIGQNTQRAILATIAKEAALLTPIVDHSFANVAYGAASVRHFRKLNMGLLRNMLMSSVGVNYNLSAKGASAVPNALKISEGNLPAFAAAYQSGACGFYMGSPLSSYDSVDVETFLASYPYLQGGDQLTLVKIVKTSGSLVNGDATFALKADRIVFAPNAFADGSVTIMEDGIFNENCLDMTKTTNAEIIRGVVGGAGKAIGCVTDDDATYCAALILSRKVNNVWQRSTQYLELTEFDDSTDNQAAIDSYGASASISDATEFLNQADESEGQEGLRGNYINVSLKIGSAAPDTDYVLAGRTESGSMEAAADTAGKISAVAFEESGSGHVPFFTLYKGVVQKAVGSGSISYPITISSETAGDWKLEALFADGSKATYNITVAVQS